MFPMLSGCIEVVGKAHDAEGIFGCDVIHASQPRRHKTKAIYNRRGWNRHLVAIQYGLNICCRLEY